MLMSLLTTWQQLAPVIRGVPGNERSERGASLVEYALLIGLIAVVCIVAITFLGSSASSALSATGSQLTP
jgi:pilus assembly protein Flp/PilA